MLEQDTVHADCLFNDIDQLQAHGINASDISKLKSAGLCTCLGVIMTTRKELLSIKGISEGKVDKIFEAASKIESATYMTARQLSEKRMATFRLSTGSDTLDNMLMGGIESMSITEVHGEYRTGKS
jgi:meiotic recombination protein DMC1